MYVYCVESCKCKQANEKGGNICDMTLASQIKLQTCWCCCCCCCSVTKSCLTLCDPMDYILPGSSVHGIFQARILKWVAISLSQDLPRWRIKPMSPALAGGFCVYTHTLKIWVIKYILWILSISRNTFLLWIYSHLNDIIVFCYLLISLITVYQTYYQTLILKAWDTNMLEKNMSLLPFSHVLF